MTDRLRLRLTVNGTAIDREVEPRRLLVDFLREDLGLTGTHVGCDTSQCGACAVRLNGQTVKSCAMLAIQAEGADILTIEGLADGDGLHPMQEAFREHHGLQCGYCTPGMVMSALQIVDGHPDPTDDEIRKGLSGNYCRCTGYHNIVAAIRDGARRMSGGA